ncbi:hypothetical protein BV25DRAFT_1824882 [Artomyces pyxidatus]|uniref:Uncharacterized protein n=1 Tax=Artomyces pyxidatus TaxID=48021 RepID=A0ACB8T2D3_9AGAM|nr:hypothetical protein BV25DRAFT_1824882 [Artomyces pyxidatus]
MPTKAHRPTLTRTHSRSSSGGSSKLGLNLQFTQKDPIQPKNDKAKRVNGHVYETNARTTSPFPRTNSTMRVQSREHVPSAAPKRGPTPHTATRPPPTSANKQHKGGFTLAASSNGSDDEDEWVSSESGAATPNNQLEEGSDDSESLTTPMDLKQQTQLPGLDTLAAVSTTPRAESPEPRPRTPTNGSAHIRIVPNRSVIVPPPADAPRPRTPELHLQRSLTPQNPPSLETADTVPSVVASGTRTEPPTPTSPRSRHHHHSGKRSSAARPPSTHSLASSKFDFAHPLRPHPLIRGQSYGHAHLAPLTVTSDPAQAQLSSSPSPPYSRGDGPLSASPTSMRTASATNTPNIQTSPTVSHFRRPSTSSAHSIATLPIQPMTAISRGPHDRTRTLSTISSSSSSAALSSLAHLPIATRPTVPHMIVYFPSPNPHSHPESVHALLPPPYVRPHLTVLAWRSPIRESYERVVHAKQRKRGG